jgi:hypothetical protein
MSRFVVFSFSWAFVLLLGMASRQMAANPANVVLCLACALVLLVPRSPLALGAACLSYLVWVAVGQGVDDVFVHVAFNGVGCVGVLLGLLLTAHCDPALWRQRFVDAYAPVAVAQAALCFFAAGFAKLNTDYFELKTSCAGVFYSHQITAFPYSLLPSDPWAEHVAVYLSLAVELVAPWLWLYHRTRRIGLWLGGVLLFLLGTNVRATYYEFTGPFLALLTLGLDWELAHRWLAGHPALPRAARAGQIAAWIGLPLLLLWAMTLGEHRPGLEARWVITRTAFVLWSLSLFAGALRAHAVPLARQPVTPRAARLLWVVLLLYAAHESMPYLGLRTKRNFTMAGNLLINREWTNHVLISSAPDLPINELAVLHRSNDPTLDRKGGWVWPTWVLEDHLARHPETWALVEIDGKKVRLRGKAMAHRKSWLVHALRIPLSPARPLPQECGHPRADKK